MPLIDRRSDSRGGAKKRRHREDADLSLHRPEVNALKVLFYNTHLFGDNPGWGHALTRFVTGYPQKYFDPERAAGLVRALRDRGSRPDGLDVIGLCEVWDNRYALMLTRELKPLYPYSYRPRLSPGTNRDEIVLGPGLLLLSKYPTSARSWHAFKESAYLDTLCQKGFAHVVVNVGRLYSLNVVLLHLQDGTTPESAQVRFQQLQQLVRYLEMSCLGNRHGTALVMGDLNIIAEDESGRPTDEYVRAAQLLQATDVYRELHPDPKSAPGFTSDAHENQLLEILYGEVRNRKRLDYFLLFNSHKYVKSRSCTVDKFPMSAIKGAERRSTVALPKFLSDHFAIAGTFALKGEANS